MSFVSQLNVGSLYASCVGTVRTRGADGFGSGCPLQHAGITATVAESVAVPVDPRTIIV